MFAPLLLAVAVLTAPAGVEKIGSEFRSCPDGTIVEFEMYDPDPNDPKAVIILFKRGDRVLAKLDTQKLTMTLASGEEMDIVTAGKKFPTPCHLPQDI